MFISKNLLLLIKLMGILKSLDGKITLYISIIVSLIIITMRIFCFKCILFLRVGADLAESNTKVVLVNCISRWLEMVSDSRVIV